MRPSRTISIPCQTILETSSIEAKPCTCENLPASPPPEFQTLGVQNVRVPMSSRARRPRSGRARSTCCLGRPRGCRGFGPIPRLRGARGSIVNCRIPLPNRGRQGARRGCGGSGVLGLWTFRGFRGCRTASRSSLSAPSVKASVRSLLLGDYP